MVSWAFCFRLWSYLAPRSSCGLFLSCLFLIVKLASSLITMWCFLELIVFDCEASLLASSSIIMWCFSQWAFVGFHGSEFGEIFDVEHFKETLKDDVRVVSALPSTLLIYKPTEEKNMPLNASPHWLSTHYGRKVHTYHTLDSLKTVLIFHFF